MSFTAVLAESPAMIQVGHFSTGKAGNALPGRWKTFDFNNIERHTDYRLVEEDGLVVVKAVADASASGLIRKISIDPKEYPIVQWRWKVANVLKKGNLHRKDGDDYPARIYIVFKYDPERLSFSERIKFEAARMLYGEYPPAATLNYIWAPNAPKGAMVPNPYTDRAMMDLREEKNNLRHVSLPAQTW